MELHINSISEFKKKHPGHYQFLVGKKKLREICDEYGWIYNNRNQYWSEELLKKDALKYNTRSEWVKQSSGAYEAAKNLGIFDECCGHMTEVRKPKGYWTEELLKKDSLNYNTRSEWKKQSSGAYNVAKNLGILDECCGHMTEVKKPNGYWTEELIKEDSLKYTTKTEWRNNSPSAYNVARRLGILDECCEHMTEVKKPNGYWTEDLLKKDALNYNTRGEWQKQSPGAYNAAINLDILDECCEHMTEVYNSWTPELVKKDALLYNSTGEWQKKSVKAYSAARRLGIFDECCEHMINGNKLRYKKKPKGYWAPEVVKKDALKYNTRSEWAKQSSGAYNVAKRLGILDECCGHMIEVYNSWTPELVKKDALKYATRNEWAKQSQSAYQAAMRLGILDECCEYMTEIKKPNGYWTEELIKEDALNYTTRNEWAKQSQSAYYTAKKLGIFDECCEHMTNGYKLRYKKK